MDNGCKLLVSYSKKKEHLTLGMPFFRKYFVELFDNAETGPMGRPGHRVRTIKVYPKKDRCNFGSGDVDSEEDYLSQGQGAPGDSDDDGLPPNEFSVDS